MVHIDFDDGDTEHLRLHLIVYRHEKVGKARSLAAQALPTSTTTAEATMQAERGPPLPSPPAKRQKQRQQQQPKVASRPQHALQSRHSAQQTGEMGADSNEEEEDEEDEDFVKADGDTGYSFPRRTRRAIWAFQKRI